MRRLLIPAVFATAMLTGGQLQAASGQGLATHTHGPLIRVAATASAAKVNETNAALRDLWLGHVFWVRNVVTAALAGDAAASKAAEEQVVANAKAIAASIKPFYGEAAEKWLFGLLAGHYGAIKGILEASIADDSKRQDTAYKGLLSNAAEIATFLSGANPHLPKDAVEGLLLAHGAHHVAQIQQLKKKDHAGEAQTWAEMTQHMYVIADALGNAIAKQFPKKFAAK